MANSINVRISHKRDTEANWLSNNPVLLNGEIALIDLDNNGIQIKIGNGIDTFDKLPYILSDGVTEGDSAGPVLNALIENFETHQEESNTKFDNIEGNLAEIEANCSDYTDNSIESLNNELTNKLKQKASLDENGIILKNELPSYVDDVIEAYINSDASQFSNNWLADSTGNLITPEKGKIYIILSEGSFCNRQYRWGGTTYALCNPSDVNSVNGKTGIVNLTPEDIGAEPYGCETRIAQHTSALVGKLDNYWQYDESSTSNVITAINQNANWVSSNFQKTSELIQDLFSNPEIVNKAPSAKATYDINKFLYDLFMPEVIYDDPTGFEANSKDIGDAWQLTGLNLSKYTRLKFYVKSAENGSNHSPSHIVELHLDNRCIGNSSHYVAGHTTIFPDSPAKLHSVIFSVSSDKTAIAFNRATRISVSSSADSKGGRSCYRIEGYFI